MVVTINGNWVKLFSKFMKWEWYKDSNTKGVFIHCLISANWKDGRFEGRVIKRGSFVTGRKKLAEELGMSEQQIRTALKHLISTNEITIATTNKYSVITIVNYEMYQQVNQQNNQQLTNNQPTTNQQLTTSKKGRREEGKKYIFIPPTVEEVRSYCSERKNNVDPQTFVDFYQGKGWMVGKNKMKDWKAAVRTWERSRKESVQSYKPEPPKYPIFQPEPEIESVPMPDDVRNRLKGMF